MNPTEIVRFGVYLVSSPHPDHGFLKKARPWVVLDCGPSCTGRVTRLAAPLTRAEPDGSRQLRVGHGLGASTLVLDALQAVPVKWFRQHMAHLDDVSREAVEVLLKGGRIFR